MEQPARIWRAVLYLLRTDETWRTGLLIAVLGFFAMGGLRGLANTLRPAPGKPKIVATSTAGAADPAGRTVVLQAIKVEPAFVLSDDILLPERPIARSDNNTPTRWRYGDSASELRPVSKTPE